MYFTSENININNNAKSKKEMLYIIEKKSKFHYELHFNNTILIFIKVKH